MNGKAGDNPLSDLAIHGAHPFPPDIEAILLEIHSIGREIGRWPLGENWPYSPREFEWERGENLTEARQILPQFLQMLKDGRGDKVLIHPITKKPLSNHA